MQQLKFHPTWTQQAQIMAISTYLKWPFSLWPCWRRSPVTPPIICRLDAKTSQNKLLQKLRVNGETSEIDHITRLLYHIEGVSSSYLDSLYENKLVSAQASITKEDSEGQSPSLVKLLRDVSVSTDNGRSWLPAFPRNYEHKKRVGKNSIKTNNSYLMSHKKLFTLLRQQLIQN